VRKLPSLAVFDLDDTLYDYRRANKVALDQLVKMMSTFANIEEGEVTRVIAASRTTVKQRLGETASSHSRILYISEAFRVLCLQPDTEMLIRLEKVYWNNFLHEMELFPGVEDLLRKFRNHGTQLALITDLTSNIQYRKISKLGLNRIFDLVLTSEECGSDKSTGIPFVILEKLLPGHSNDAWFFGDSQFDHPNQENTNHIFFKKSMSRSIKKIPGGFEFGDYLKLGKKIEQIR
jgi:putative hydrolase of the HAD superfamily